MKILYSGEEDNFDKEIEICEHVFKCKICEFRCDKEITLQKHMKTKHAFIVSKAESLLRKKHI